MIRRFMVALWLCSTLQISMITLRTATARKPRHYAFYVHECAHLPRYYTLLLYRPPLSLTPCSASSNGYHGGTMPSPASPVQSRHYSFVAGSEK